MAQKNKHNFNCNPSLSVLTAIFPGEPGLAGVYWSKGDGRGGATGAIPL